MVDTVKNYFNYNAAPGKKTVQGFTQGVVTDYRNDQIVWGSVTAPAAQTSFENLTTEQKQVVASALGYTLHLGATYHVNPSADPLLRVVSGFGSADYNVASIDWGGVPAPAQTAPFVSLTAAQQDVVLADLGFARVSRAVFVDLDNADAAKRVVDTLPNLSTTYSTQTSLNWGSLYKPLDGVSFDDLTAAQQDVIIADAGYSRWSGPVFFKAAAQAYRVSFEQGASGDYENANIRWSDIEVPDALTAFVDLSAEQQARVLASTGFEAYFGTVYHKANAGLNTVRQTFVEGEGGDYLNQAMPWAAGGDAIKTNRWLLTDSQDPEKFFVVYAYDSNNDGVAEELQLREAHPLTGQRGFGFLMTGTLTTLQPNTDLRVEVEDAAIVRGTINLMGAGSDLFIQSDTFTYWEGEATVPGTITLLGGVAVNGTNLLGDNGRGTSLYIHAASQMYAAGGTGSIVLQGGEDVEIHGRVVAGGYSTGNQGPVWTVDDASINVRAGQRILVDSALTATGHVRLETTSAPSVDDAGWGVVVGTAGGLNALGRTTTGGSTVVIDAVGGITFMGQATSGGVVVPATVQNPTETVSWAENDSTLTLRSAGKVYLGGMALARDGTYAERGGTFRASELITVQSGVAADGTGVKLPGTGRLTTSQEDGRIVINALGNADLFGLIVAGGEIIDHEDATGAYLGSKANYFDGDSQIVVQAQRQVNLGKGLVAGKLIDVRGGTGTQAPTVAEPWLDDGVVLSGDTRLKTLRENSQIKLSASGDVTVMLPAWKEEILADGFAQLATGRFTGGDVKFAVSINLGSGFTAPTTVTVAAASLSDNDDLLDLVADVQAALDTALGTNSTQLQVRLFEGRLQFVSPAYKFNIASVSGGGAERLGLTQISAANPTTGATASVRLPTVDASQRGSKVIIGNPTLEAGSVTMSGYVRAHQSIEFNTLPRAPARRMCGSRPAAGSRR